MCRWFTYISTKPILLEDAIVNPVHAITQQARGNFQEENLLNADGFGIAWYTKTWSQFDSENVFGAFPALYRTTTGKALNDATFRYLCRGTASNVILSHLRGAFGSVASTNNHPFVFGRSSFMHNGFIQQFQEIRAEMLKKTRPRYAKLIGGSTDTEHLAALYFSYLEKEKPDGYFGASKEKRYSARAMWNALQRAIRQVEEIQSKRFKKKLNNTLNICTTNGESMIVLCYRTVPWAPPATLYLSVDVPDKLDRRNNDSYEDPKDRTLNQLDEDEKAAREFKAEALLHENRLYGGEPPSIVIASEPVTFDSDDWYRIHSGQAILIDPDTDNLKIKVEYMPLARATAVIHPGYSDRAIMFSNNLYAVVKFTESPDIEFIEKGDIAVALDPPRKDLPRWSSGVDAVIPDPKNPGRYHFFGGDKYMYVAINPTKSPLSMTVLSEKPSNIDEVWTCFKGKGDFTSISTILPVPDHSDQAWFFSGNGSKYVLVRWTQNSDGTISNPKMGDSETVANTDWGRRAKFSTVNMTLPHWKDKKKAWFFSGERVVLVENIKASNFMGSTAVSEGEPVKNHWPACFYEIPKYPAVPSFNAIQNVAEDDEEEKKKREDLIKEREDDVRVSGPLVNPDDKGQSGNEDRDEGGKCEGGSMTEGNDDSARFQGRISSMIFPWNEDRAYILYNDRYILMDISRRSVAQSWRPITESELKHIGSQYLSLWNSGVDAVFPMPLRNGHDAHFFCGDTYLSSIVVDTKPSRGPNPVSQVWECLKTAGFAKIDAALEIPDNKNELWFFSDRNFIRVGWSPGYGDKIQSSIIEGPTRIVDSWSALKDASFSRVDMVLPGEQRGQVWVFSGTRCALISIGRSAAESSLLTGPKSVKDEWPSELASCFGI